MLTRDTLEKSKFLLANLSPSRGQRQLALFIASTLIIAFFITAPFARVPLQRMEVFIPATQGVVFANDLFTAVLLYSQFSISRSLGILFLASSYFFVSLIVIPHALTFPGAFAPTGLLGAGPQTTAWLYNFWHIVFPIGVIIYALFKDSERSFPANLIRQAILTSCAFVVLLVVGITWLTTQGASLLPRFFANGDAHTLTVYYVGAIDIILGTAALALLWVKRRSILDLWLMVAMLALILEVTLVAELTADRFRLGFYAGRIYTLSTSITVLVALISETIRLDARLAQSNMMLQRERDNRLFSVAAVAGAIAHEVRQPLMAIAMNSGAAIRFLSLDPPNHTEVRLALEDIVRDSHRTSEVFENIGGLFRGNANVTSPIDINKLTGDVIQMLSAELTESKTTLHADLRSGIPLINGNQGQLQEVIINLVKNAVEAMGSNEIGKRHIWIRTALLNEDEISVEVEDSGPGISSDSLSDVFEAFVTSKSQGMGLGLAICRTIIERHGGQLQGTSNSISTGASFRFVLPITSPPLPLMFG